VKYSAPNSHIFRRAPSTLNTAYFLRNKSQFIGATDKNLTTVPNFM
jgi:hypothetical protein